MYYIPRIYALLLVFFLSTQVLAEQSPVVNESGGGINLPSSTVTTETDGPVVVPGYFKPKPSVVSVATPPTTPAESEPIGSSLFMLLGVSALGLVFFWLGRRSKPSPVMLDMHRRVAPTPRVRHEGRVVSEEATKYWVELDQTTTVTVDELSSVEEEAEVFLLLGRVDMAIGVLRHHVEANKAAPAHVWMSLLDILHAQGLRQEFEKLAAEIRERFNVALPTWESANARSHELTGLEHFPHLFAKITSYWNTPECLEYLHSLTQDNRNGERGGFHLEAFRELLMLIGVLENKEKMADPQAMPA